MKYDCLVVLAGGIMDDGTLPRIVEQRIDKAKELFDLKLADHIVMSGKWSKWREKNAHPPQTEAKAMEKYAIKIGIPKKIIYREEKSTSTVTNAHHILVDYLMPNNWKNVVVVTSDIHLLRAKGIFDSQFGPRYHITYVSSPSDFRPVKWIEWKVKDLIFIFAKAFAKLSKSLI